MLERPALADADIITALARGYGLTVARLDFLPVGNDATAWAFHVVDDAGSTWFLKVRRNPPAPAGLTVPRLLRDAGVDAVVAPVRARSGALAVPVPATPFFLVLYPFVTGASAMDVGLTPSQWRTLGAILRRIHQQAAAPSLPTEIPRESFAPPWRDMVDRVDAYVARAVALSATVPEDSEAQSATVPEDSAAQSATVQEDSVAQSATVQEDSVTAAFIQAWAARRDEILALVARCVDLGVRMQGQDVAFALCHADIHTANILVDPAGALHIVDWDGALLAPRERDLMFFVGCEVEPARMSAEARAFLDGYGTVPRELAPLDPVTLEPVSLAYYLYEWVVQELGDYGARLLFMPELGRATREQALAEFIQLFAPGDVVAGAYAIEPHLSCDAR